MSRLQQLATYSCQRLPSAPNPPSQQPSFQRSPANACACPPSPKTSPERQPCHPTPAPSGLSGLQEALEPMIAAGIEPMRQRGKSIRGRGTVCPDAEQGLRACLPYWTADRPAGGLPACLEACEQQCAAAVCSLSLPKPSKAWALCSRSAWAKWCWRRWATASLYQHIRAGVGVMLMWHVRVHAPAQRAARQPPPAALAASCHQACLAPACSLQPHQPLSTASPRLPRWWIGPRAADEPPGAGQLVAAGDRAALAVEAAPTAGLVFRAAAGILAAQVVCDYPAWLPEE